MAPSIDYEVSSLLCAEDNTSVFDEEVDNNSNYYNGNDFEICIGNPKYSFHYQDYNFLNGNGPNFSVPSDECLASMFDKEIHSYLGFDYLKRFNNGDLSLTSRNQAVLWILKVLHFLDRFCFLIGFLPKMTLALFISLFETINEIFFCGFFFFGDSLLNNALIMDCLLFFCYLLGLDT